MTVRTEVFVGQSIRWMRGVHALNGFLNHRKPLRAPLFTPSSRTVLFEDVYCSLGGGGVLAEGYGDGYS